jgi:hypothetical protein
MARLEGWGFLCLIGCPVAVALSLSLLSGGWQVAGTLAGVALGVLAGGLYAASVRSPSVPDAAPGSLGEPK